MRSGLTVLGMGERAVLVEAGPFDPPTLAELITLDLGERVEDVLPAATTVLVRLVEEVTPDIVDRIAELSATTVESARTVDGAVDIDVRYDGEDLSAVADALGLSVTEVIEMHSAAEYRVDFCGPAPGFAYLGGLPAHLHLPRRATPRVRVPAGSVAIAAGYSAVYPTASPGGWHLLGSTATVLWDVQRIPPSPLRPGVVVRFRPV